MTQYGIIKQINLLLILSMSSLSSALPPIIENYLKQSVALPGLETLPIQELRNRFNERQRSFNENAPTYNLIIQNEVAETSHGVIPIRIYRSQTESLSPTLVFFHGGGFVFGNLDSLECHCREIAYFTNCMVISVDYPLAPEHPFPAAPEAAYAATKWIYTHLNEWEGDHKNFFVGGSSSGGTLSAAVSIMARDRGGPKLSGQILLCPMTDANFNTSSYHENAVGYNLTREHCIWFLSKYSPDFSQRNNPLLAPLRALNFKDLPPTLIVTAEFDPLRDEGRAFAKKLQEAEVRCHDLCYKGMIHGFSTLPLELPEKKDVLNQIKHFIEENKNS